MKIILSLIASILLAGAVAAEPARKDGLVQESEQVFRTSFRADNPKYWMRRIEQDPTQALCSQYRDRPPAKIAKTIMKSQMATIRYPVDGKLIGDWKEGERIAASGRGGHIGFIQPDPPKTPRGGNCYACHQMAKQELAYGTIGPSLQHYGKLRGNSEEILKYTYDKLYNSNAFAACTNMPRFGYAGWLTPEQITDLVAFLLDPQSPVNQD